MASESMQHPPPQKSTSGALSRVSGLLQKHHDEIRHGVTAMGIGAGRQNGSKIDELLSDISQQVLQRSAKYDPTRRFIPWVMGFVPYVLKQRARTHRQERHQAATITDLNISVDQMLVDRRKRKETVETQEVLELCLSQLSEDERLLVESYFVNGLESAELAQRLKISEGAMRVRLHRVRQRLREIGRRIEGGAA